MYTPKSRHPINQRCNCPHYDAHIKTETKKQFSMEAKPEKIENELKTIEFEEKAIEKAELNFEDSKDDLENELEIENPQNDREKSEEKVLEDSKIDRENGLKTDENKVRKTTVFKLSPLQLQMLQEKFDLDMDEDGDLIIVNGP